MFGTLAKWAARIDDAARIPEYVARAYSVAVSGRPGPVVLALPEDMLRDAVEAIDRPRVERPAQVPCPREIGAIGDKLRAAGRPVAIVGGAGWTAPSGAAFGRFAEAWGLPVAAAFRRQDAVANDCAVYAGNLGYGPNPKLAQRVRDADLLLVVGARLGEATTDGYALVTPDHPGQTLIHIHPDPNELGRVYRTDQAMCVDMSVGLALETLDSPSPRPSAGEEAHREWLEWSTAPARDIALDMGQVVMHLRDALPADSIVCNGAGNFSGWFHRYWHYAALPSQLAPTNGSMGYGLPAGVAAALRFPNRQVIVAAGDGDFLMNGQELATAVRHGADMLVLVIDNASYGTIRMHQEREYPERLSGTDLVNPDFAALARAFGAWAETVERTEEFAPALERAKAQRGVKLLHLKTDVENITANTTITALRDRAKAL